MLWIVPKKEVNIFLEAFKFIGCNRPLETNLNEIDEGNLASRLYLEACVARVTHKVYPLCKVNFDEGVLT